MKQSLCHFPQGKSSDIDQAKQIFRSISQPDVITYTSMSNFMSHFCFTDIFSH